jgi:hypothetical protein
MGPFQPEDDTTKITLQHKELTSRELNAGANLNPFPYLVRRLQRLLAHRPSPPKRHRGHAGQRLFGHPRRPAYGPGRPRRLLVQLVRRDLCAQAHPGPARSAHRRPELVRGHRGAGLGGRDQSVSLFFFISDILFSHSGLFSFVQFTKFGFANLWYSVVLNGTGPRPRSQDRERITHGQVLGLLGPYREA